MTSNNQRPKTPKQYLREGREWLGEAENNLVEGQASATQAMLAMASALLGICAQFIQDNEDD